MKIRAGWVAISGIVIFLGGIGSAAGGLITALGYFYPQTPVKDRLDSLQQYVGGKATVGAQILQPRPAVRPPVRDREGPVLLEALQTSVVGGVTAGVTSAFVKQNRIWANLTLTNNTPNRFYFTDARSDPSQIMTIDGGQSLGSPNVTQMPNCNSDAANCQTNPNETLLSKSTYLDSGQTLPVSLNWNIGDADIPSAQHVSFSMTLIGRLTDTSPDEARLPTPAPYRFNFRGIPVSH